MKQSTKTFLLSLFVSYVLGNLYYGGSSILKWDLSFIITSLFFSVVISLLSIINNEK